ncbi:MAG: DUF5671 domain-containing protein [Patescibacteria group bacterium]|jgi:hypothetical protein
MMALSFLSPFIILAIIVFAIAAIIEGKNSMKKGSIIRSLYFYLTSLVTLAIVVGSLVVLVNLGLKAWVFEDANNGYDSVLGPPSSLYFVETSSPDKAALPITQGLTCTDGCTLTDSQRTSIQDWKTSFQSWLEANANPGSRNARDAVTALSFLIVALPFFLIHFRIVQKDAKVAGDEEKTAIRPTYFYFVSLASLLMIVIAGGFLINIVLKTWVFPSAGEADELASKVSTPVDFSGDTAVASLVSCGEKCGIDQETIALAERWDDEYMTWQEQNSRTINNRQRQAATSIPFVLLGIPLFWYHWFVVRKEAKEKKHDDVPPHSSI